VAYNFKRQQTFCIRIESIQLTLCCLFRQFVLFNYVFFICLPPCLNESLNSKSSKLTNPQVKAKTTTTAKATATATLVITKTVCRNENSFGTKKPSLLEKKKRCHLFRPKIFGVWPIQAKLRKAPRHTIDAHGSSAEDINSGKSQRGLTETQKLAVKEYFELNLKPKRINELLHQKNIPPQNINQINSYLKLLRTQKFGPTTISLGQLEQWCLDNTSMPDDIDF